MSPLAIPSAPPHAASGTDTGSPPAVGGNSFEQTLQQSQPAPKPGGDGHAAHEDRGTPARENRKADAGAQADEQSGNDTNPLPGIAPVIVPAAAPMRQSLAGGGEALPATGKQPVRAAPAAPTTTVAIATNATPASLAFAADVPPSAASNATSPDAKLATALQLLQGHAGMPGGTQGKDAAVASHAAPDDLLAHLAQLAGSHAAATPAQAPPPAQLMMQAAPGQPQFAQEAAQHVAWLAGQNIQRAEIQLNPRRLGPIQVEITTHHDRVDVSFAVQHPQTVHALQQTLPQLHDMLAQQGLNLGNASVGQQSHGQPHATPAHRAGGDTAVAEPESQPTLHRVRIATPGRVDDFA